MGLSLKIPPRFTARKPRADVAIEATLLLPDDTEAMVLIRNISDGGFMGETDANLSTYALVGIALPGFGIFPVSIRWTSGREIGAQFRRPLDLDLLERAHATALEERSLFTARVLQRPV